MVLYLDTETTGLGSLPGTDFVEVGLVDDEGNILIDTLCDPGFPIPRAAQQIHGISDQMLVGKPKSDVIREQVIDAVRGHELVIYNSAFDTRFFPGIRDAANSIECCMELFAAYFGDFHDYFESFTWQKLTVAASAAGYEWQGDSHRAVADALATRHVWHFLKSEGFGYQKAEEERLAARSEAAFNFEYR